MQKSEAELSQGAHLNYSKIESSGRSEGEMSIRIEPSSSTQNTFNPQTFQPPYLSPPNVTYHLQTQPKAWKKKKAFLSQSQVSKLSQSQVSQSASVYPPRSQTSFNEPFDNMSMSSSKYQKMLKSNHNGLYFEEMEKIRRFKGLNHDYFEKVIVSDIMTSPNVAESKKHEVVRFYQALCVFSANNVLFYKRLYKHETQFGLEHGDPQRNIYKEPDEQLPRLKDLLQGHLKFGPGIRPIREFYNNNDIIKDQYSTLLHAILRVIFSKVRDYIIELYPNLSWLLNTIKPGTARFNYSNAVSLALLHANKEFSPQMHTCFVKIAKVVFYFGEIQDIKLEDLQALFELLRERNEQHLVPMKLEDSKAQRAEHKRYANKSYSYLPYVPYAEPEFDVDFQVPRPSSEQIFQKCGEYTTRNWSHKFQRYVLALYMQHQNFIELKEIINMEYQNFLGRQIDLQELRLKFENSMKKLTIYLQFELNYMIRRSNIGQLQTYKIDFATKKFLTLNKCEKRALFSSDHARNCRMYIIDYYLNNYLRKGKSYKMSAINYRLTYLWRTIDAVMMFLRTKIGESQILNETEREKEDTYPFRLVSNAYFSIIKSVLKEILLQKALRTNDLTQKMIKNANAKRSLVTAEEVEKLFDDLKPDDLMQIEELYMLERSKSLIVKRNPKMFPNFKITPALQVGFVHNEWEKLTKIIERRGAADIEEEHEERNEKFEISQGFDMGMDEIYNEAKESNSKKTSTKSQERGSSQRIKDQQESQQEDQEREEKERQKREKAEFMKALQESTFIKTELLILKINEEQNNFKKYFK